MGYRLSRGGCDMKTIWKFTLSPKCEIEMPKYAKILSVETQHNEAQMWVLVNPKEEPETRCFRCYGTGHEMPDYPGEYVGTFQINHGALVFHAFEVTK